MTAVVSMITLFCILVAVADWRRGLLLVIVIGVLQDPMRKLTPGTPSLFIVWSMAVYLMVVTIAFFSKSIPAFRTMNFNDQRVRSAWVFFLMLVVLQLFNAFVRWGTPAVPIFGVVFYFGPPLAMLVGYAFANSPKRLRKYFVFYALILTPVCLTVYLSPYWQDSYPVLRDIGTFTGQELIIYDVGTILKSYSGLLRAGEISAWHAATAAIFLAILAITTRGTARKVVIVILIVMLVGVIILTGRRKMLMTLSIFFIVQWALMARFRQGLGKLSVIIVLVGTLASFSFTLLEPSSESSLYVQRGSSVFGESTQRMGTALLLMKSAFNRSGGIGLGAGSGAQGARFAGVDQSQLVGGSAESGLGMVMVELGVLGLVAIIWLLFTVTHSILGNLRQLSFLDKNIFMIQVSLMAFLFANLMTFTVATQIYGDFFVLIILGTVAGFVLRINSVVSGRKRLQKNIQTIRP